MKHSPLQLSLLAGAVLITLGNPDAVNAEPADTAPGVFTLGEIEVSSLAEEQTNPATEQVTSESMREFDRNTVGRAADLLPGVTLSTTGARNEQTLSVRGFDIKHVPLFLDGIPIYVPYDGYPDLGRFTTFDLSTLVISKGFASVLYGPNTMGGAINMVSRRPEKQLEGDAGIGISSGDTSVAYANAGTNRGNWYLQAGGSYISSDYYPLSDDFSAVASEDGDHRDNSSFRDEKASFKVGFTPNKDDEYAFSYINQHGDKGTPPYTGTDPNTQVRYWQWPYWDKQSYYLTTNTNIAGKGYVKTRAYYDIFQNSLWSFDDASYSTISKKYAFRSWYDDYTNGASVELGTPLLPNNLLKLAMHYKLDVHREHNEGNPIQKFRDQMLSAGLEDTITFTKALYAVAGLGYDTIKTLDAQDLTSDGTLSDFPMESTSGINPQFGLFYQLAEQSTVHASIAHKSRLPTIKDRYSYKLGRAIPNPDLDPERSLNVEIGYENNQWQKLQWESTVFYNDVSDYIQEVRVPDPADTSATKQQNQNIGEVDLAGFELAVKSALTDALEIGCSYTYTYADNKSGSSELINIPEHKLAPYLRYIYAQRLITQLDAELYSDRYSNAEGTRVADGFAVVNAKVGYDFHNGLLAETGIRNVMDEDYELEEGYPEPGRIFFANLRYTF